MQTKTGLTVTTDSEELASPLEAVVAELRQWRKHGHWWEPESEDQLEGLTVPAKTREDWDLSFGKLASLVFGSLHVDAIQSALTEEGVPFEPSEGPLSLLQKIVAAREADGTVEKLCGLATILAMRPESGQQEHAATDAFWQEAQAHDSPTAHFETVCDQVEAELRAIFRALDHRYRRLAAKYA